MSQALIYSTRRTAIVLLVLVAALLAAIAFSAAVAASGAGHPFLISPGNCGAECAIHSLLARTA